MNIQFILICFAWTGVVVYLRGESIFEYIAFLHTYSSTVPFVPICEHTQLLAVYFCFFVYLYFVGVYHGYDVDLVLLVIPAQGCL